MKTAKALGFKKGDFVKTALFPGIIVADVHTTTPCCEVWGIEHETGSAYSEELTRITRADFIMLCAMNGHSQPIQAYDKLAQKVILAEGGLAW